jgi:hypothetical protein
MIDKLEKILVVEDNIEFAKAGFEFFRGIGVSSDWSPDYESAISQLDALTYDGVISDCFFPRVNGRQDRELGKIVIDRMYSTDQTAKRVDEYERYFSNVLDYNDPELKRIARYIGFRSREEPEKNPAALSIRQVGKLGKEVIGLILKKDARLMFGRIEDFKDYYTALREAMEKDPANQALGIIVAEKCKNRGIPAVIATSTYHHDVLTQPVQNYCSRIGIPLVDCGPDSPHQKASPEFWKRAYETLLREMKR